MLSITRVFTGRINRRDWLMGKAYMLLFLLLSFLLGGFIAHVFERDVDLLGIANIAWFLLTVWIVMISLSLDVRRLHDFNKNWHWVLILVIPLAVLPYVLFLLLKKGDENENKFGPPPAPRESLRMILNNP